MASQCGRHAASRFLGRIASSRSPPLLQPTPKTLLANTHRHLPLTLHPVRRLTAQAEKEEKIVDASASAADQAPPLHKKNAKQFPFQAETGQLMDIMANSLYVDKEVFLRELISNASDALEKARYYQSSNNAQLVDPDTPLEIRITADEANATLIIQDSGIGMTREELMSHLGTIARSGSKQFMKQLKESSSTSNTNIIGQFGVGFYSSFMVGNKIEVFSQSAVKADEPSHYWSSDGHGSYELAEIPRQARGTKVVIHLKQDALEFAAKHTAETIIKKYSNFVGFPIFFNGERMNTMGALWLQDKSSISEEQHTEFYKYYCNAWDTPLYRLHFSVDAPIAIHALFYFPESHMEKYGMGRLEPGVSLYSRKVLIKPKCKEVLPEWLRFVKGVVDSEDIPLNISRENMQDSRLINRINSALTRKIIRFLEDEAKNNPEKYKQFFEEFGSFIKEGVCTDWNNKNDAAKLLRFETSLEAGKLSSFDDYISRMPPEQKDIYYLSAPNRESALASPYYESHKAKGTEVLFLYAHIDDFVMKNLGEFHNRRLVSVESGEISSSDSAAENKEPAMANQEEMLAWLQSTLDERVSSVKASTRLVNSPCIIVDHESAAVRRMMKYVDQSGNGGERPLPKQKLEVNLGHPILQQLSSIKESNPSLAASIADQLFDNALIQADIMDNPRTMIPRLNKLMEEALKTQTKQSV